MLHLWKDVEHKEYRKNWTDADTEYVIKNHKTMTDREIAKVLRFKKERVSSRLHVLRESRVIADVRVRRLDEKEKEYILKKRNIKTIKEIAEHLNRAESTIRRFIKNIVNKV